MTGEAPLHEVLTHGFAECMQDSLFEQSPFVPEADDAEGTQPRAAALGGATGGSSSEPDGAGVDRAMLVLQLLLGAHQGQAPNLAHLLLGLSVEDGSQGALGVKP